MTLQHFPWVHDALGIERLLHRRHQRQLDRRAVFLQLDLLELADAMFGAEAAVQFRREIVDLAVYALRVG